jgi:uracil-DNA glycosylase family 4
MAGPEFNLKCTKCPRLAEFLKEVRSKHPDYHALPVAPFGEPDAKLLIVGLAPGYHGANATGRPFTGDFAGILLYETLYESGFSTAPESISADDNLRLINCRITNAVKCLPPDNKPIGAEINTCNVYLKAELEALDDASVIVVLGTIAHNAVIKALGLKAKDFKFGHANEHVLPRGLMIDSYHCSRYNTQTRRLTAAMFKQIFKRASELLN